MSRAGTTRPAPARGGARPDRRPLIFFLLLAAVLYANTLGHRYALDDTMVITENAYVKEGINGIPKIFAHDSFEGYFKEKKALVSGGRYRPLSIATFAFEHQWFGLAPGVSHFVNLALYGITCALLYLLLSRLLPAETGRVWWMTAPFLITLLFAAHPLHTEVAANLKGRDEILALLLGIASFLAAVKYAARGAKPDTMALAGAGALFLFALFAKESVAPFLVLVPLGLWVFRKGEARRIGMVAAALVAAAALYAVIRIAAAGPVSNLRTTELLNDPFLAASAEQRVATIFKTVAVYFRLFFVPHPLTHDYYYNQIPLTTLADPASLAGAVITLVLLVAALAGIGKRSPFAYGIVFFGATFLIVSNLFFSVGTTMAERFLYIPSLGLAIALVLVLRALSARVAGKAAAVATAAVVGLVSLAFAAKTISRNPVWKDNRTLFATDVKTSPNSAKIQAALGAELLDEARRTKDAAEATRLQSAGLAHFRRALEIHPRYSMAWARVGDAYLEMGGDSMAKAVEYYQRAAAIDPADALGFRKLALAANKSGDYAAAVGYIQQYRTYRPDESLAMDLEAEFSEKAGRLDRAMELWEELTRKDPSYAHAWGEAGRMVARVRGDNARARELLRRGVELEPGNLSNHVNLGSVELLMGETQAALKTLETAYARFGDEPTLDYALAVAWDRLGDAAKRDQFLAKSRASK